MARHYKDWREGRRFRAWELSQQGWGVTAIAQALGASKGAVSQWLKKARAQGAEALQAKAHPGRPTRLTPAQRAALPALLAEGPQAYGFEGERWTRRRVAELIRRHFGVRYSPWQVGRILRRVGHSPQKPILRASQRNEAAIETWQAEKLPAIQKKGSHRSAHARVRG